MAKISLIIPVYNRLELLKNCLLAISVQSLKPDEIILADDGSSEDIRGFWKAIQSEMDIPMRLTIQAHADFRAGRNRNNGVSISNGDLLIFVDQDILISRNYITEIVRQTRQGRYLSGYPIRLSQVQTQALTEDMILRGDYSSILKPFQTRKIKKQYWKDKINGILYKCGRLAPCGAKLRGGVSAIRREDFIRVNGYDEHYVGWGNEDDDLGRRLLAMGAIGYNFAYSEYPIHMYHQPFHQNGIRINQDYATQRRKQIKRNNYRCDKGLSTPRPDVEIVTI